MTDSQWNVILITLCIVLTAVLTVPVGFAQGRFKAEKEFKSCRGWLADRDSATVLALKPECTKWTVPDKLHWQFNVPPSLR